MSNITGSLFNHGSWNGGVTRYECNLCYTSPKSTAFLVNNCSVASVKGMPSIPFQCLVCF